MSVQLIEKIKKLLRVGQPNSGATEAEAAAAMELAAGLMLKHGLDVDLEDDSPKEAIYGKWSPEGYGEDWHIQCSQAAGYLYSCRPLWLRRQGSVQFVGRSDNIEACEMTFAWLVSEVERLYKQRLPKGLSQSDRANFRRTFKFACAHRLAARAWAILEMLKHDDAKAIAYTGKNALVVVQSVQEMLAEADSLIGKGDHRTMTVRNRNAGLGTHEGRLAGDSVQLQKRV